MTFYRSSNEVDTPFGPERTRISEAVLPTLVGVPGVEAAEGQVVGQIRVLDKDNQPHWHWPEVSGISAAEIAAHFQPAWDGEHPLADL